MGLNSKLCVCCRNPFVPKHKPNMQIYCKDCARFLQAERARIRVPLYKRITLLKAKVEDVRELVRLFGEERFVGIRVASMTTEQFIVKLNKIIEGGSK